jgi:hypothetical protein
MSARKVRPPAEIRADDRFIMRCTRVSPPPARRAHVSLVVGIDVASALLRRRTPDNLARQLAGHTVTITSVTTYGGLTKWTLVRHWGPRRLDTMRTS